MEERKKKKKITKKISFILSTALVGSLLLQTSIFNTVNAEGSESTPSVKVFATQKQLMDNNYFNLSEGSSKLGKISFGKDSGKNKMNWYIAGRDSGNSKPNLVLFAAKPLQNDILFNNRLDPSKNNEIDTNSLSGDYGTYSGNPSIDKVYVNHYGASNLRSAIKELEGNTDLFSASEQSFMLPTTFSTTDTKNDADYTLTDTLYLPQCIYNSYQIPSDDVIKLGSADNIDVSPDFFPSENGNSPFWLRSPIKSAKDDNSHFAIFVNEQNKLSGLTYSSHSNIRPAFDLDLSSVLFASSAPVLKYDDIDFIDSDAAMIPRFDGKDKIPITTKMDKGTVDFTWTGPFEEGIHIIIQGKDEKGEWYSNNTITETVKSITYNYLKTNFPGQLTDNPNLSECKIWMEKTVDGITYAKMVNDSGETKPEAFDITKSNTENGSFTVHNDSNEITTAAEGTPISITPVPGENYDIDTITVTKTDESDTKVKVTPPSGDSGDYTFTMPDYPVTITVTFKEKEVPDPIEISSVEIEDITPPIPGQSLDNTASCQTPGIATTSPSVSYTMTRDEASGNANFNRTYTANMTLLAEDGYAFANNISDSDVTVNGDHASSVTLNEDHTLSVTYDFITEKANLISIIQPEDITEVTNGTEKTAEALGLPESVTIETQDPSITEAEVSWNLDSTAYDPSVLTEQTFQVSGTVILPEDITNTDNISTDITIYVTVLAKEDTPDIPTEHIHNWHSSWKFDKNAHWHNCIAENCPITENREKDGYGGHIEDQGRITTEPTLESKGVRIYTCTVCGYVTRTEVVAQLDPEHTHNWDTAWENDEGFHWHNCTAENCPITENSEKEGYSEHTEDAGTVTTEPTEEGTGIMTYTCTVCGYVVRTETIPATGTKNDIVNPENHDDTGIQNNDNNNSYHNNSSSKKIIKKEEPKTGELSLIIIYTIIVLSAIIFYMVVCFVRSMPEERKQNLVHTLILWAKEGSRLRRYAVLAFIFIFLAYYHSIGKQDMQNE